jgi:hypothetical protein
MKHLWLIISLLPALSFAEFAVVHDELKDGSKMEVAHVDAGAVQMPITGQLNAAVKSGAFKVDAPITNTATFDKEVFKAEAGAFKVDAPMNVQKGAFEFSLYPRAFSLNFDEGSIQVPINVKLDLGPAAEKIAAVIKPAQEAAAGVEAVVGHWRLIAEGIGGLALALAVGWYFSHHGQKKVIAVLKEQNGNLA